MSSGWWIQSIPCNPISLWSIPILSSHLRQGLSNDLFPSRFPNKILYILITHVCPCPSRLILLPLTPQEYLVRNTYQAVSHIVVSSSLVLFLLRRPKYFPLQPILEHPQPRHIQFPYCKAHSGPSEQNLNRFKATGLTSSMQSWPFDFMMRPVAVNTEDLNFMMSEKWRLQPLYKLLIREKSANI
jgi:hypothetical protein